MVCESHNFRLANLGKEEKDMNESSMDNTTIIMDPYGFISSHHHIAPMVVSGLQSLGPGVRNGTNEWATGLMIGDPFHTLSLEIFRSIKEI